MTALVNLKELAERAEQVLEGYPAVIPEEGRFDWLLLKLQEELGELT